MASSSYASASNSVLSSAASASSSVLSSAASLTDSLFQLSLSDLIKSLRSDPSTLSRAISDIHREIRSPEPLTKSIALEKLTYLSSLHFVSMSFASFQTLELLASPIIPIKRIAYLSASLSLHHSNELLPLCTHQLHKDLTSLSDTSYHLPSLALNFLSVVSSPDLSSHLAPDLVPLLSKPSPLQPKAVACSYRLLSFSPNTVPILFKPLVDCLNSQNPNTVSTAISAFCELSSPPNDPSPYLPLAPEIYKILVNSKNNWILIKALKIFCRLVPLEPRLGSRIVGPICQFLRQSQAKSLVLECVKTVFICLLNYEEAFKLAIEKIKDFLSSDDDPNLRYLGLQTLGMLGEDHIQSLEENRETISRFLTDPDRSISKKALELIINMTTQSNSIETFSLLVKQASKSDLDLGNEILEFVLTTCRKDYYALVMDFDWYVELLGEMAKIPFCIKGDEIGRQMVDIGFRVRDARQELVRVSRDLLIDPCLCGNQFLNNCLSACAFISGEYIEFCKDLIEILEALLQPRVSLLPGFIRGIYTQSTLKVLIFSFGKLEKGEISIDYVLKMINLIEMNLGPLLESDDVAVLERVRNLFGVINLLKMNINDEKRDEVIKILSNCLFSEEMGPVSLNAQKRVQVPEGLDLKENLADLADFINEDNNNNNNNNNNLVSFNERESENLEREEIKSNNNSILLEHRKRHGLYYLPVENDEKINEIIEQNYPLVEDNLSPIDNLSQ